MSTAMFILERATGVWHRPLEARAERPSAEASLCGETFVAAAGAFEDCRQVNALCHHCEEILEGAPTA
jgi:hypothetical protein